MGLSLYRLGAGPRPGGAPLISGGLGQSVLGLTAYAWIDSKFYVEAGGYSSPKAGTLRWLGADPFDPGDINGIAPYGRVAFQTDLAGGTFEAGAFALKAALWPGRDRSGGRPTAIRTSGLTRRGSNRWVRHADAQWPLYAREAVARCDLRHRDGGRVDRSRPAVRLRRRYAQ